MKYLVIFIILAVFLNINTKSYKKEIVLLQDKAQTSFYNKKYGILVDYRLHSGKARMFLISFKEKKIVRRMLVAHGSGSNSILGIPIKFSNLCGSNASSLGYSVISGRGESRYGVGVKYILEGISNTNSSNKRRNIVLHSYSTILPFSTFPIPTIQSKGCPTISNRDLKWLDSFIKKQKNKKILIYSFK